VKPIGSFVSKNKLSITIHFN